MNPKLSVIVPVYNAGQCLIKCLDALKNQELRECEFICVNDGSTDDSYKILEQFHKMDSRFIILDTPNGGPGKARNIGLELAKGEYIGFCDQDDFVSPDYYSSLCKQADENKLDICFCPIRHNYVDSWDNKYSVSGEEALQDEIIPFFIDKQIEPWCKIYRRQFLNEHSIRFNETKHGEDIPFAFLCLFNHPKVAFNKTTYYNRLLHTDSCSYRHCSFEGLNRYGELYQWLQKKNLPLDEEKYWKKLLISRMLFSFKWVYQVRMNNEFNLSISFQKSKKNPSAFWYKLLYKFTFGKTRQKYKKKYKEVR